MLSNRQKRRLRKLKRHFLPAIPPDDYKGSVAEWHYALCELGLWDGEDPSEIMDIKINKVEYTLLLNICEGKD